MVGTGSVPVHHFGTTKCAIDLDASPLGGTTGCCGDVTSSAEKEYVKCYDDAMDLCCYSLWFYTILAGYKTVFLISNQIVKNCTIYKASFDQLLLMGPIYIYLVVHFYSFP